MEQKTFTHSNPDTELVISRRRYASTSFPGVVDTLKHLKAGESFDVDVADGEELLTEEVALPQEPQEEAVAAVAPETESTPPQDYGSITAPVTSQSDSGTIGGRLLDAVAGIFKPDGEKNQ